MSGVLWIVLSIIAAAGAGLCLYIMHGRLIPALKALDKDFALPDMRFRYGAKELYACLDGVGDSGRAMLRRYWLADFGFIACFWLIMVLVGRNNVHNEILQAVMLAAASLRALLDIIENLILLKLNAIYPVRREKLASVCGGVTSAKFIALGVWIAGMFAALFVSAIKLG